MLKHINPGVLGEGEWIEIQNAKFPTPFISGLEYSAPVRGPWNIVHTGMLIPEAYEIFVCAENCLRGVVLTAIEMGKANRFSTIAIKENNILEGDMEELIIDRVSDILEALPKKPRAVLIYTSCVHHFIGCDLSYCYEVLKNRHIDIDFIDCYMNPIMRKSGMTPDEIMRKQLYGLLKKKNFKDKTINIIGNNIKTDESSDIVKIIKKAGYTLQDITLCNTYEEYQELACGSINISYNPVARAGAVELLKRFSQQDLYLPLSYDAEEIKENMKRLADRLNVAYDLEVEQDEAIKSLCKAKEILKDTEIVIDYTATMRPLGLAKLLLEQGFNVTKVYLDVFNVEEKSAFDWLAKFFPKLRIYATVHAKMRVLNRDNKEKVVAIGQKSAYFTNTQNFVNIVEGGGMYGFDGIKRLANLIIEAFLEEKDMKRLVGQKGWGCDCLL